MFRILALFLCLLAASATRAQGIAVVDDAELSAMRGKFVSQGQVIGFGLQMLTRWQSGDGAVREASLNVSADLRGAGRSSVQASVVSQGAMTQSARGFVGVQAPTVNGTYQGVQVAGDANDVSNRMEIQVQRGEVRLELPAGNPLAQAAGAIAEVTSSGVARVRVDTPGGFAEQRMGPNAGPSQISAVASNGASVQNLTRLSVNLGSSGPAPALALEALRALPVQRR